MPTIAEVKVSDSHDFSLTKERIRALMQKRMEDCLDAALAGAYTGGSLFDWVESVMGHLIEYKSDYGRRGLLEVAFDPYNAGELVPCFLEKLS